MTRSSCPRPSELLAYQDDELSPERQAELHLHVQQCRYCQANISASNEVGRLVRAHNEVVDDPQGLEILKERLRELSPSRRPGPRRVRLAAAAVSLALVVVVGISVVSGGGVVESGDTFAPWIVLDDLVKRVAPSERSQPQPVVAPTGVLRPTALPFGLAQVGEEQRSPGFIGRYYSNPDGLSIFFTAERSGSAAGTLPADQPDTQRVVVAGREVLLSIVQPFDAVYLILWVEADVLMRALVLEQPPDGLDPAAAIEIAEALMSSDFTVP